MWVEFDVGSRRVLQFSPCPQKLAFPNSNSIRNLRATGLSVVTDCLDLFIFYFLFMKKKILAHSLHTWRWTQLVIEAALRSSQRRINTSSRPNRSDIRVLHAQFACLSDVAGYTGHFTILKIFHLKTQRSVTIFVDKNGTRNS